MYFEAMGHFFFRISVYSSDCISTYTEMYSVIDTNILFEQDHANICGRSLSLVTPEVCQPLGCQLTLALFLFIYLLFGPG